MEGTNREEFEEHQERLILLGRSVSVLAHEVNNPLTALVLSLDAIDLKLARSSALRDEIGPQLRDARVCLDHIVQVIGQIAEFGRPRRVARRAVCLRGVVQTALTLLGARAEAGISGATLCTTLDATAPVLGERTHLVQIAVNLISNAVEAVRGEAGGRVAVRTSECVRTGRAGLLVEDNGPGIPPQMQDALFQPFVCREGGTGLGLWVSAKIAAAHAGTLTHERTPQGCTRFSLWLPTGPADETALSDRPAGG